jgi:hypothetical protein
MSKWSRATAVIAAVVATGCGGSRNIGELPDGGAGLPGTWDLVITPSGSSPTNAVVVIATNSLGASASSSAFNLIPISSGLQVGIGTGSGAQSATATRNGANFAGGIIPFDMGGAWNIQGGSPAVVCNGTVGQAVIDSTCSGSGSGSPTGTFTATRTSTESSDYGDLGGVWGYQDNGGGQCTIEFKGGSATSICSAAGPMTGDFTVQFNGNTVSGTAPNNIEFLATRRAQ